jgi:hypothetical protein
MTDTLPRVVVPYADFLAHRDRRRAMVAEIERQDVGRTIDTEAVSAAPMPPDEGAIAIPRVSEEPHRSESQSPAHNAERIT